MAMDGGGDPAIPLRIALLHTALLRGPENPAKQAL